MLYHCCCCLQLNIKTKFLTSLICNTFLFHLGVWKNLPKLIKNLSSLNKGYHDYDDVVWISDITYMYCACMMMWVGPLCSVDIILHSSM